MGKFKMKKMALFSVFTVMSLILLSTVSLPVFAHGPIGPMVLPIEFSGDIAISIVPEIIQWRIAVDGTITIDGVVHEGIYTVVKMMNGEIRHGPASAFMWHPKRIMLRMSFKEMDSSLSVVWKRDSPSNYGLFDETIGGDHFSFDDNVYYQDAEVTTRQVSNRGSIYHTKTIHRTGWGYIINALDATGTIS